MYLFYVQGGGLGHLSRTDKLIKTLGYTPDEVIIITPSFFSHHFTSYTFVKINWNDSKTQWTNVIENVLKEFPIHTCYIDAFPLGLKGELISIYEQYKNLNFCYVSRVLKWEVYIENMPHFDAILFKKTLLLEPLYPRHLQWIAKHSKISREIKLNYTSKEAASIPFEESEYGLLVHSGGKKDVEFLCDYVLKDLKKQQMHSLKIIVFTQVDIDFSHPQFQIIKNVFPVFSYYENAAIIYTAAGFNSIYELKAYENKHIAIPIDRFYDDQFFRVKHRKKH